MAVGSRKGQRAGATSGSSYGAMFAMSTLALLPTLICFLIFQKRLVEGLATSGMKG